MYARQASEAEARYWGLTLADLDDAITPIFPDNLAATNVFVAMQTQWRVGAAGATGLDYTALPAVLQLCGVPPADHPDTFEAIRVMEAEALDVMNEAKK